MAGCGAVQQAPSRAGGTPVRRTLPISITAGAVTIFDSPLDSILLSINIYIYTVLNVVFLFCFIARFIAVHKSVLARGAC